MEYSGRPTDPQLAPFLKRLKKSAYQADQNYLGHIPNPGHVCVCGLAIPL